MSQKGHKENGRREKDVEVDKNTIRVNSTSSRKRRSTFLSLQVVEDLSVFNKRMIDQKQNDTNNIIDYRQNTCRHYLAIEYYSVRHSWVERRVGGNIRDQFIQHKTNNVMCCSSSRNCIIFVFILYIYHCVLFF